MPLQVLENLMGLQEGAVMISINQSWDDMVEGVVNIIVEGSALDPYFLTHGQCIEGQVIFQTGEDGQLVCRIKPPESENLPE
tara:strand:- start:361 stop:606 length:246 start_codon:yes stop_codon:yes gene_type:complete